MWARHGGLARSLLASLFTPSTLTSGAAFMWSAVLSPARAGSVRSFWCGPSGGVFTLTLAPCVTLATTRAPIPLVRNRGPRGGLGRPNQ